jgi:hypothetical protein
MDNCLVGDRMRASGHDVVIPLRSGCCTDRPFMMPLMMAKQKAAVWCRP